MATLRYRGVFTPQVDPCFPEALSPKIYVLWHEYLLIPFYLRGYCNISMLLSQHGDAEILRHAAGLMGFECIRGSTSRGGSAAIMQLLERSQFNHLAITPDGPRGPRRHLAQGPVYLASRTGLTVIALGFGFDRPWRLKSWDRFAIPRPFSRACTVISSEMVIPPDLDREGVEHYRQQVEAVLARVTLEAERWAEQKIEPPQGAKTWRRKLPRALRRLSKNRRLDAAHDPATAKPRSSAVPTDPQVG
jgi:lysophospholipid acyltransferase (LPLAT)-like uncharacterized protein